VTNILCNKAKLAYIDYYNGHFMFETIEIKDVKIEIGQMVKAIRKQRKISQTALASTLNVSRATIQNLESGKNFTVDTLLKVLKEVDMIERLYHKISEVRNHIESAESLY